MEFLDTPVVKVLMICAAIFLVVRIALRFIPRKAQQEMSDTRRMQLRGFVRQLSDDEKDDLLQYLNEGRKVLAIKYFRAATKTGLRDAKEAVEYMKSGYDKS